MSAKRSKKKGKKQRSPGQGHGQGHAGAQATARKLESSPPMRIEPASGMRLASVPNAAPPEPTTVEIVGAIVEAIAAPFLDSSPATSVPAGELASETREVAAKHAPEGEGRDSASDTPATISSQSVAPDVGSASATSTAYEDREVLTPRVWEHRRTPRVAIAVDIDLSSESHFFSGLSGDVSEGGVFVQTYRDIAIGSEVAVEFALPGGHVSAHGKVRWHRDKSDSSPPGVGIAFDELSQEDREKIHSFCEARAPLYYDVEHA